jgi:predicted DNA-binding protein
MRKTSLYLDEEQQHLLKHLAEREHRPQAEIVRDAISLYAHSRQDRRFAVAGIGRDGTEAIPWDGRAIAELSDDELLRGLGEA